MRSLFLFLLLIPLCAQGYSRIVKTQQDFNQVVKEINSGVPVSVSLKKGAYILHEPLVATAPLTIVGKNATITDACDQYTRADAVQVTPTHYVCKLKNPLSPFALFINEDRELVDVTESVEASTRVNFADSISVVGEDYSGVHIRIPISENLHSIRNRIFPVAYGYFDCGWTLYKFQLHRSDDKFIYCTILNKSNLSNYNYEKTAYKKLIRYVLYNTELQNNSVYYTDQLIYIPKQIQRLSAVECKVFGQSKASLTSTSDLILKGVTFDAINGIKIDSQEENQCEISSCTFTNTLGNTFLISKKNSESCIPAHLTKCRFVRCALLADPMLQVSSNYLTHPCIHVNACTFTRYPDAAVGYKNASAMMLVSADACISDCEMYNTCRSHLFLYCGTLVSR